MPLTVLVRKHVQHAIPPAENVLRPLLRVVLEGALDELVRAGVARGSLLVAVPGGHARAPHVLLAQVHALLEHAAHLDLLRTRDHCRGKRKGFSLSAF